MAAFIARSSHEIPEFFFRFSGRTFVFDNVDFTLENGTFHSDSVKIHTFPEELKMRGQVLQKMTTLIGI